MIFEFCIENSIHIFFISERIFGKTTCPLTVRKTPSCIDLEPPSDIADALETCWNEAIMIDFQCNSKTATRAQWFKEKFGPDADVNTYGGDGKKPKEEAEGSGGFSGWMKRAGSMVKKANAWVKKISDFDWYKSKFNYKTSFHWSVYFTKDFAPFICPVITTDTQTQIKNSFRNCFSTKTGIKLGNSVDISQVKEVMDRYEGNSLDKTTVFLAISSCSSAANRAEFSDCTLSYLADYCREKKDGPIDKTSWRVWLSCQPCFNLTSSDQLKEAMKTCKENQGFKDFGQALLQCYHGNNYEKSEEYLNKMGKLWINLLIPYGDAGTFRLTKSGREEIHNCISDKFNMGTMDKVNPDGFKDLIQNHLVGDEENKAFLVETVDKCATSPSVSRIAFKTCMEGYMDTKCSN